MENNKYKHWSKLKAKKKNNSGMKKVKLVNKINVKVERLPNVEFIIRKKCTL